MNYKETALGLAVDLGTTKIAAFLLDLETNRVVAKSSSPNPQIRYGEDVISRILFCVEQEDGRLIMQNKVVETINSLVKNMCETIRVNPGQVVEAVVVGNTVMHHFFAGLPVEQLGLSPFTPAVTHSLELEAEKIGIFISPHGCIYLPENIAGYIGGDHVAMMVASKVNEAKDIVLALDIGTNTEISLVNNGTIYSCSCASGPTFEGAHIHDGMRASDGAIERINIENDSVYIQTIGGQKTDWHLWIRNIGCHR